MNPLITVPPYPPSLTSLWPITATLWIVCLAVFALLVVLAWRARTTRRGRLLGGVLAAGGVNLAWQYIAPCGPICHFCLLNWPYWICYL